MTSTIERPTLEVFDADQFKGGHGGQGRCSLAKQHEDGGPFASSDATAAFMRSTGKDGKQRQALCEDHAIAEYSADELAAALGRVQDAPIAEQAEQPVEQAEQAAENATDEQAEQAAENAMDEQEERTEPQPTEAVLRMREWAYIAFLRTQASQPVRSIFEQAKPRKFGKNTSWAVTSDDPVNFLAAANALEAAAIEVLGDKRSDASARVFMKIRRDALNRYAEITGQDVPADELSRNVATLVAERPKPERDAEGPVGPTDTAPEVDESYQDEGDPIETDTAPIEVEEPVEPEAIVEQV